MQQQILGIIPSRFGSTRLEGKALIDIGGKSMVRRVYEQAQKCQRLDKVIVATDDQRIFDHIISFGGEVMMTSAQHTNGTDRCAEVAKKLGGSFGVIINIQGDEPFINPQQIDQVAALFEDPNTQIATLGKKIMSYAELIDEKEAKIVLNERFEAIYMSRSPVPFLRNVPITQWHSEQDYYKHIGIYGFQSQILANISQLPISKVEILEGLEQLRWLAHYKIKVGVTEFETFAIDTAEDLERVKEFLDKN